MISYFFFDFIILNYALIISRVLCVDLLESLIDGVSFYDILFVSDQLSRGSLSFL